MKEKAMVGNEANGGLADVSTRSNDGMAEADDGGEEQPKKKRKRKHKSSTAAE